MWGIFTSSHTVIYLLTVIKGGKGIFSWGTGDIKWSKPERRRLSASFGLGLITRRNFSTRPPTGGPKVLRTWPTTDWCSDRDPVMCDTTDGCAQEVYPIQMTVFVFRWRTDEHFGTKNSHRLYSSYRGRISTERRDINPHRSHPLPLLYTHNTHSNRNTASGILFGRKK